LLMLTPHNYARLSKTLAKTYKYLDSYRKMDNRVAVTKASRMIFAMLLKWVQDQTNPGKA